LYDKTPVRRGQDFVLPELQPTATTAGPFRILPTTNEPTVNIARFFSPTIVLVLSLCISAAAAPQAPTNLAVEDCASPIGIGDATPEFSWLPRDARPGAVQSAYQILVASSPEKLSEEKADKWDSGEIQSDSVAYIAYAGKPLATREACWWKVRTADADGNWGPWSAPARFEIGLLADDDWTGAKWIWAKDDSPGTLQHYYFRKSITLPDKPIARARLYVSSVHHHLLYVDDQLIGKGQAFENPECQYYQTFDIGPHLKPGRKQVLGARCHWFRDGQGRPAARPGFLCKAVIDFADGDSLTVSSDSSWKSRRAEWVVEDKPWRRNGEGIPYEFIDGRRHPSGWNRPDYDDSDWAGVVEIGPQPTEPWVRPLTAQETSVDEYEIAPVGIKKISDNHLVADFGKVYAGRPKVRFTGGEPGSLMRIRCDYRAREDGTIDGFDQGTRLDYEYTLRGGEEMFDPFWYHGLRYVAVEAGQLVERNGRKTKVLREYDLTPKFEGSDIRIVVRHNRVDAEQSSFECSDAMLNAVWDLVKRSAKLGSHECYVDTPTREQGQFTHDGYQTSIAAMKCFGERDLAQQALRQFAHSQDKWWPGGQVNAVYPYGGRRDIPDWTQSWVFWAYDYYMETGDRELIGDIFDNLVRTGEYNKRSENKETGLIDWGGCEPEAGRPSYPTGIVDWPNRNRFGYDMTTTQRTVLSCFAYMNYLYVARLADALGKDAEAKRFGQYAADIRDAIQRHLWNDEKSAYVDGLNADGSQSPKTSQQANMLPLVLGFAEGEHTRGALAAVNRAGRSTGPMIVRYLIQAYGEHDQDDALLRYLIDPEGGRNWAHIIVDGGTFTYEDWEGTTSQSHPQSSYAGVIAIQDYILGVKPLAPQYARVQIRPHPGALKFAKGVIPTQRGPIRVDWRNDADTKAFRMTVSIPCNVRADVYVPKDAAGTAVTVDGALQEGEDAGKYVRIPDVGSGEHEFVRRPR